MKYVRVKPKEGEAPAELIRGEGIIVGHIIGINRRHNLMVKDSAENKAYTVELFAVDATEAEENEYLLHHMMIQQIVEEHNARLKEYEVKETQKANLLIDQLNAEKFGPTII